MAQGSILLVEPPEGDRPMYADSLRNSGFTVREVESTVEGLVAAPDADLVITAIRMPGSFDGIELVRRLRDDVSTKHKPLIVLTACTLEPDQSRAFSAGCDVFLPKPCLPEMLVAETERLIDLKAGQRASSKSVQRDSDLNKKSRRIRKPLHR